MYDDCCKPLPADGIVNKIIQDYLTMNLAHPPCCPKSLKGMCVRAGLRPWAAGGRMRSMFECAGLRNPTRDDLHGVFTRFCGGNTVTNTDAMLQTLIAECEYFTTDNAEDELVYNVY